VAKYEFKIAVEPWPADEGGVRNVTDPTLEQMADAIKTGVEAVYGDDFEVRVYDGERPDRD
jgi:hypothetical protein